MGASLASLTGMIALALVVFAAGVFGLLEFFWGKALDPENQPLIGADENGIIYSVVVVLLGVLAVWSPKWGGFGLAACALTGFLLGPRDSLIPVLVLGAAVLCLTAWWTGKDRVEKER